MSWSSRLLLLGCLIGGLQVAACLALLVRAPTEGVRDGDSILVLSTR
jgi:hypothetical protein